MQIASGDAKSDEIRGSNKGRRARHVIVIAGASGSGKTELIKKLSRRPHDAFTSRVLNHLGCDPNQRLKRSTVERMQRLMDPTNYKKRKTRKLQHCLLLHIDLTSINHKNNLKLLQEVSKRTKRIDVITLYTSPQEWRQRIFDRLHTENEPSKRAALIALSAKVSAKISNSLYQREYSKWLKEITKYKPHRQCIINTFDELFLLSIPDQQRLNTDG